MSDAEYFCAAICENGHVASSCLDNPKCEERFCKECGAPIITECPACGKPIRGHFNDLNSLMRKYQVPKYCVYCGAPYPWTKFALDATNELIAEDENLSKDEKNLLSQSLPDVMVETPRTQLAATQIKRSLKIAGQFTTEAIKQFVIDFGCELALKATGISK